MIFPVTVSIGQVHIPAHLIFEIAAYISGISLYRYLRKKHPDHLDNNTRILILLGAIGGALVGSKLLSFFEHPEYINQPHALVLYLLYSKSIVGGLLGGLIGVELVKALNHIRISTGDSFTYPLILGMIIGRIGCFLSGVHDGTHGIVTTFPLGMDLGDGLIRHPTALYEIFILLGIALYIYTMSKFYTLPKGATFKIFMVLYLIWRLWIENYKPVETIPNLPLTAIQLACCVGLLYYCILFLFMFRSKETL
ncbi:MAG: prolipoprotein diacylglyceryl transferase [Proteobacteria bacterium]|nr:prolipoprotein diacylglyceryl transferase [Pseudomonadota bacterium]